MAERISSQTEKINLELMKIIDTRPNLFGKSSCNIWTDPHIQKQILKAHLNPLSDGASRREESILKITNFILHNTKPGTRLLDLGCGPGLYTSLFKDRGYSVTGIDFNKASIEYATEKREDIEYILGDYIKEYPTGKYDVAIMIYCDIGTHSDNDRDILLKNIYQSLDENGTFIFDVFNDDLTKDKKENRSWDYSASEGFWSNDEYLLLSQTFHYPQNKAFASQYNLLTEKENKYFIIWDRYYSEEEITIILKDIGFKSVSIHKDILGDNNFTSNSEMFIVAKK